MLSLLEQASTQSLDPLEDGAESLVVAYRVRQPGGRGRPRLEFDPGFLAAALELRGPTGVASIFGCSSRTIHRRAVEYGILQPGEPVYTDSPQPDGTIRRTYQSSTRPVSTLSDDDLDTLVADILQVFPAFGSRMIIGCLKAAGHHVPRARIVESYARVHGRTGRFGDRSIHRRKYQVPGSNSLWHHDGQHGT